LTQGELEGVGAGAVEEVAEVELGLSEGGVLVGDEVLGQVAGELLDARAEGFGEAVGLGLLVGGQRRSGHGILSTLTDTCCR
jgi:hypothetical protein